MTPSDDTCNVCKMVHGFAVTHSMAEILAATIADRDRLAERVKELSRELGNCDDARGKAILEREANAEAARLANATVRQFEAGMKDLRERLATAEADNAALVRLLQRWLLLADMGNQLDDCIVQGEKLIIDTGEALKAAHPGTALTQRLMEMEELLRTAIRIFESKEMVSVCMVSQMHHAPYSGEIFPAEKAKQALEVGK